MEGIQAETERKQTVGHLAAVILGAVKTSVYIYLEPVITVVTSVRVLHETITLTAAAGTVLTMEPASAVLAAPHSDAMLHAATQRVVDYICNAAGVQHRRAPSRLHRLKTKGDGVENEQLRVLWRTVKIVQGRLLLGVSPSAVYVQNQNANLVLQVLGVSVSTAYELMHEPGFPVLRVGSRMVVPKEKFIRWTEEQSGGAI